MEVMPGSHKLDQIPHRDTFAKHNLLTRGQEIAVEVDHSKTVRLDLEPGEISLHHVRLVHGSPSNTSDDRRIGFAIRYIPTYLRQLFGDDSASLVRGEDRYRHFELEPRPVRDMDPDMLALHQAIPVTTKPRQRRPRRTRWTGSTKTCAERLTTGRRDTKSP